MSSHVTARRGSLEYAGADFESDTLIRIHNGDGYLDCSEQDFRYFVRDYQGNIRTVYGSALKNLKFIEIDKPPRHLATVPFDWFDRGDDHKGASHQAELYKDGDGNKTLVEMIINSKKETIKNMQEQ